MIDLAETIAAMKASGLDDAAIVAALSCIRDVPSVPVIVHDEAAERRRAKDRERKRLRNSAEFQGTGETDLSLDKEIPPTPPKETKPLPTSTSRAPAKRASRLPSDWTLPPDWRAEAIKIGLTPQRADAEGQTILDWSLSSPNGAKLDWRATWRIWCKRIVREMAPNARPPPPQKRGVGGVFGDIVEEYGSGQGNDYRSGQAPGASVLSLPYRVTG